MSGPTDGVSSPEEASRRLGAARLVVEGAAFQVQAVNNWVESVIETLGIVGMNVRAAEFNQIKHGLTEVMLAMEECSGLLLASTQEIEMLD